MKLNFKIGAINDPETTVTGMKLECEFESAELKEVKRMIVEQLEDVLEIEKFKKHYTKLDRLEKRIHEIKLEINKKEGYERQLLEEELERIQKIIDGVPIDEDNNQKESDKDNVEEGEMV